MQNLLKNHNFKVYAVSFASEGFLQQQLKQRAHLLRAGFSNVNIISSGPKDLGSDFFSECPFASESNRFGYYSFKPYIIKSLLRRLPEHAILLYIDANDRPLPGLYDYIVEHFKSNPDIQALCPLTNYPNLFRVSRYHRYFMRLQQRINSLIFCQPETGLIIFRSTTEGRYLADCWYSLTLNLSHKLYNDKHDERSKHDQETFFLVSRLFRNIGLQSWFSWKFFKSGIRKYVEFEYFRNHEL